MTKVFWSQNGLLPPPSQPLQMHLYISFIYIYVYIYNIESVFFFFVKKYFNDHIYLSRHDGFRKGGGSIMGELRRERQEGEAGVRSIRNCLGSNKCPSKGGTNRIFINVSHFKEVLMIQVGARTPSLLLYPSPKSFPPPCILMPHGSLPHVSLGPMLPCIPGLMGMAHMSLALGA